MDFQLFKQKIQKQLATELPGETAHSELMPVNRISNRALKDTSKLRKSAVGLILFPEAKTIKCILIKRPNYDGVHSGQICFPGGKMDVEDRNLEQTARRECYEAIHLPFGTGELIGELSEVYIPVSQFIVHPFVFTLSQKPKLYPDEREVHSIIAFDALDLLNEDVLKTKDIRLTQTYTQKNVPYFDIQGHVVWGATAMMLAEFRMLMRMVL